MKVTGQGGLTVPRLRRQVRDIERFGASVVIDVDVKHMGMVKSSVLGPRRTGG